MEMGKSRGIESGLHKQPRTNSCPTQIDTDDEYFCIIPSLNDCPELSPRYPQDDPEVRSIGNVRDGSYLSRPSHNGPSLTRSSFPRHSRTSILSDPRLSKLFEISQELEIIADSMPSSQQENEKNDYLLEDDQAHIKDADADEDEDDILHAHHQPLNDKHSETINLIDKEFFQLIPPPRYSSFSDSQMSTSTLGGSSSSLQTEVKRHPQVMHEDMNAESRRPLESSFVYDQDVDEDDDHEEEEESLVVEHRLHERGPDCHQTPQGRRRAGGGGGLDVAEDSVQSEPMWQSRCLELEKSLARFRDQANNIREILKDKLTELEARVQDAELRADEAEDKVQVLERRLEEVDWSPTQISQQSEVFQKESLKKDKIIRSLENEVETQRQQRLSDAKQVEAKAARIKDWVTNKLRELEEQNAHLRQQNAYCNEQMELLRNRLEQLQVLGQTRNRESNAEDSSLGSLEGEQGRSEESLTDVSGYLETSSKKSSARRPHMSSSTIDPLYAQIDSGRKSRNATNRELKSRSADPTALGLEPPANPASLVLEPLTRTGNLAARDSRVDSGSVDLGTPLEMSPKSPLEVLDEALDKVMPSNFSLPVAPPRSKKKGETDTESESFHKTDKKKAGPPHPVMSDEHNDYSEIFTPTDPDDKWPMRKSELSGHDETNSGECSSLRTASADSGLSARLAGPTPTPPPHSCSHTPSQIVLGAQLESKSESSHAGEDKPSAAAQFFGHINVPVFATVTGRASQVQATPVTGESSDSSDNEDENTNSELALLSSSQCPSTPKSGAGGRGGGGPRRRSCSTNSPGRKPLSSSSTASGGMSKSSCYTPSLPRRNLNNSKLLAAQQQHGANDQANHHLLGPGRSLPFAASASTNTTNNLSHAAATNSRSVNLKGPHGPGIKGTARSTNLTPNADTSYDSDASNDYAIPPDAGHSIYAPPSSSRHSFLDSPRRSGEKCVEKCGYLTKLGGKLKSWHKRYFILKDGTLAYWKSQHDVDRKPQGMIVLTDSCQVSRAEGSSTFQISLGQRTHYLTAESQPIAEEWVRVLQNIIQRNALRLLLTREDTEPTLQGWLTKVKHGHSRRCWCVLIGKMFIYFKTPSDQSPLGQVNMRDTRVEEVDHISDSDSEEGNEGKGGETRPTIGIFPNHIHQGPTYLIFNNKSDKETWLYQLTVVSGGDPKSGTQFEQLVQRLMEVDGEASSELWRHPLLVHTKEPPLAPLTTFTSEPLQQEAIKLFKSIQLFCSVVLNSSGIDYHVVLAQNAIQHCLNIPQLQPELLVILAKQTTKPPHVRHGVQSFLLNATNLFSCDSSSSPQKCSPSAGQASPGQTSCKGTASPSSTTFIQAWMMMAIAVSIFVPKNSKILWFLRTHLNRCKDSNSETGKYAAYCANALERSVAQGPRLAKPSRMEVLSILLKNPHHHSLPHSLPVHLTNGAYQVVGFDGSTTMSEFVDSLTSQLLCRSSHLSGFTIVSDDPIESGVEHSLASTDKVCDVMSWWETGLRDRGMGKFQNNRVIKFTFKNRLHWKRSIAGETEKEKLFLCYQVSKQMLEGRFPVNRELAFELAALMAQIEWGDLPQEKTRAQPMVSEALTKFYPTRYRTDGPEVEETLLDRWSQLNGKSSSDCVRILLTCTRKWALFGYSLFHLKTVPEDEDIWLAVGEDGLAVLQFSSLQVAVRYPFASIVTFGGCQEDFMLVVNADDSGGATRKLTYSGSKIKILELTLLIADYMNTLGQLVPGGTRTQSRSASRNRPSRLPSTPRLKDRSVTRKSSSISHTEDRGRSSARRQ